MVAHLMKVLKPSAELAIWAGAVLACDLRACPSRCVTRGGGGALTDQDHPSGGEGSPASLRFKALGPCQRHQELPGDVTDACHPHHQHQQFRHACARSPAPTSVVNCTWWSTTTPPPVPRGSRPA